MEDLKLFNHGADIWIADTISGNSNLERTTHLAIGAHQDDLEIMAYEGIAACYDRDDRWFTGVVVTDGRGSSRTGPYSHYTDEEMRMTRRAEQRNAAGLGKYAAQFQLDYSSAEVKDDSEGKVVGDLIAILEATRPEVVYLHQPADKHDTHVALLVCCIKALRQLSPNYKPKRLLGCEVWRGLDWLLDDEKIAMDCSAYPELASNLIAVFESQIAGGKRYDHGTLGRRCANATYFDARSADSSDSIAWALDLMPLIDDPDLSLKTFIREKLDRLSCDVESRIDRY